MGVLTAVTGHTLTTLPYSMITCLSVPLFYFQNVNTRKCTQAIAANKIDLRTYVLYNATPHSRKAQETHRRR